MNIITTEKIKIWGIVQGVGFRPFVAKIAHRLQMKGQVLNLGGLVEITVTDTPKRIQVFLDVLAREKPVPAEIVHMSRNKVADEYFQGFTILHSLENQESEEDAVMIPADLSLCEDCLSEMRNPKNRRYQHPFISCMVCGPRYTIIHRVPYDRDTTTMVDFPMCPQCEKEYTSLHDRRYHAQTISCHDCGPYMKVKSKAYPESQNWIETGVSILKAGGVLAFKSMGGYNLLADPYSEEGVAALREIKKRDDKPFAVQFASLDQIKASCYVSETEAKLLESSARPILLLTQRPDGPKMVEAEKSRFIGGFLPSVGAQYLLLEAFGGPLIATSANLSGLPMICSDQEMFRLMESTPLIRGTLYHERTIEVGCDDSVARVIDDNPQMIRRAKGYAPVPLYVEGGSGQILAVGPQLKNAFALSKGPYAYISQYFGDLDSLETKEIYGQNVVRMAQLFGIHPQAVVCDLHPLYTTTSYAEAYAKERNLPLIRVQHHHAHVASVMAEHNLKGPVIGVSFDGTGYGTDGKIWGGEFLICEGNAMQRWSHLRYIRMIGGDASMKDARKSAWSLLFHEQPRVNEQENTKKLKDSMDADNAQQLVLDLSAFFEFATREQTLGHEQDALFIRKALEHDVNTIESSSMGRLFDGIAALLGICDYNGYEGQCAMMLEDAAYRASMEPGVDKASDLALAFHLKIADMILEQCIQIRQETGISQVALTGGVFQNKILMEESLKRLIRKGFQPYYNISVSPNDGGIALGQLYIAQHTVQ